MLSCFRCSRSVSPPPFPIIAPPFTDFLREATRPGIGFSDSLIVDKGKIIKKAHRNVSSEEAEKTWKVFSASLHRAFSDRKIEDRCSRYGFDLTQAIEEKRPLQRQIIEYFAVGSARVEIKDLEEYLHDGEELASCSVEQIGQLYEMAIENSYPRDVEDPRDIYGAPPYDHQLIFTDTFKREKQLCDSMLGMEKLIPKDPNIPYLHRAFERLTMCNIPLLKTQRGQKDLDVIIPVPGNKAGTLDFYKVHKIISSGGFTAAALSPVSKHSTLKPTLIVRCTEQGLSKGKASIDSLLNNTEYKNGESGYLQSKKALDELMADRSFTGGKKIRVCAYSLGGAHATYFMRDFWNQVFEFIGFNCEGVAQEVAEDFANQVNALDPKRLPPKIYHYRNKYDWVNGIGKKHLGQGVNHPNHFIQVIEWLIHDMPVLSTNPLEIELWGRIHACRPMDSRTTYKYNLYKGATLCDRILDTYKRDPTIENIRIEWGHGLIHNIINQIYHLFDFLFRFFDIKFFERHSR